MAKIELEEGYYEISSSKDYIYYKDLNLISNYYQLSEDVSNHLEPDTKIFFSSGEYLFFSLSSITLFKINEYINQNQDSKEVSINLIKIGFFIIILIVILIGLFLYMRYKRKAEKIQINN